jgi:hypothetical protein
MHANEIKHSVIWGAGGTSSRWACPQEISVVPLPICTNFGTIVYHTVQTDDDDLENTKNSQATTIRKRQKFYHFHVHRHVFARWDETMIFFKCMFRNHLELFGFHNHFGLFKRRKRATLTDNLENCTSDTA